MKKKLVLLALAFLTSLLILGCQTTTTTTVTLPIQVTPNYTSLTLAVGSSAKLTYLAENLPSGSDAVQYISSDTSIVSVNQAGDIEAIGSGEAEIRLVFQEVIYAVCEVHVAADIEIVPPNKTIYLLNDSLNLRGAKILLKDALDVVIASMDIDIAMLSAYDMSQPGEQLIDFTYESTHYAFPIYILNEKQAVARFDDFILLNETAVTTDKIEFAFTKSDLSAFRDAIGNVYDYDEINLYVQFVSPSNQVIRADAFWFQDYTEAITYRAVNTSWNLEGTVTSLPGDYQLRLDYVASGDPQYRVRYQTAEAGEHRAEVFVMVDGAIIQKFTKTFTVEPIQDETYHGYVQIDQTNGRHFSFTDGKTYMPIGQNVAWYTSLDRKYYDYLTWFGKMGDVGANFARVWLAAWGFSPFWRDVYDYDERQSNLTSLDKTIEAAEENGIYIQLTLLHHGMFSAIVNPMWPNTANTWYTNKYGANPYADFLTNPSQFFTSDVAKDAFMDMLQYIVARYGYSDHLMAWELFNEVDWIEGYSATSGTLWHKQMAEFIQSIDSYDHLVTTSVKGDSYLTSIYNVFKLDAIDYVNVHRYGISDHIATLPSRQDAGYNVFGKPIFYSEIGTSGNSGVDQIAIDPDHSTLHDALWGGMMGGGAGGGANWWWESWIHPANAYYVYQGAAAFADKLDLSGSYSHLADEAYTTSSSSLDVLGYLVDDRIYAYFYGSGNASFSLAMPIGSYTVTFYDTVDGSMLQQSTVTLSQSLFSIQVPTFDTDVAMIATRTAG